MKCKAALHLEKVLHKLLGLAEMVHISAEMERYPIQDPFRFRAKYLGLKVANALLDEKGDLNQNNLNLLLQHLEPYILGPNQESNHLILSHIRHCLEQIGQREIALWIKKFSPPVCHKQCEQLLRYTLWPENMVHLQTVHVRKAVLAAWLTPLRQSTGSCFATAPAILIQKERPQQFFKDLYDLITIGQLKRVIGGKEYSVPLNPYVSSPELQKVWPFIPLQAPGIRLALHAIGIEGEVLKVEGTIEQLLRETALKMSGLTEEDLEEELRLAKVQISPMHGVPRFSEKSKKIGVMKKQIEQGAIAFSSMTECFLLRAWEYTIASFCDVKTEFAKWNLYIGLGIPPEQKGGIGEFLYNYLNNELQQCNSELETIQNEAMHEKEAIEYLDAMRASKSELSVHEARFNELMERRQEMIEKAEFLSKLFSTLVNQYDQKLQEYFQELFDPSIAGERGHIFEDSPAGFRLVYKHGLRDASKWTYIDSGEKFVTVLREFFSITERELDIQGPVHTRFVSDLITSLIQYVQTDEFIVCAIQRAQANGRKSPWDYISGGNLESLLMSYCQRESGFTAMRNIPHSINDLFSFFKSQLSNYQQLVYSPTHAFVLLPSFLQTQCKAALHWVWTPEKQEHVVHKIMDLLPMDEQALFLHVFRQKNVSLDKKEFRNALIDSLSMRIKNKEVLIDGALYEQCPLFEANEAQDILAKILGAQPPHLDRSFYGPYELYQIAQKVMATAFFSPVDLDTKICEKLRDMGICSTPVLFADTNWSEWFFGFTLNPSTEELELWRLNRTGMRGFPMHDWKEWFSSQNIAPWTILSQPKEYLL